MKMGSDGKHCKVAPKPGGHEVLGPRWFIYYKNKNEQL